MSTAIKNLLLFAGPIILGQLSQMLIGVGDVFMAGKHSTTAVAAIGVANGIINPIFLFGIGLLLGISPKLAHKRGEGSEVNQYLPSLIYYTVFISIFSIVAMLLVKNVVGMINLEAELVPIVEEYIDIVCWSFFFSYIFMAIKEFLQSFEKVKLANTISILSVFLNLLLNYLFIFGWEFIPAMGIKGLAYASLSVRIFMALIMLPFILKHFVSFKFDTKFAKEIFWFSLPVGAMFFVEVLAFCLVSVLSGLLGVLEAATNNIVMNVASLSFMVPLSISSAVAVKIGLDFGAKNFESLKTNIKASLVISCMFMALTACFFWFTPALVMGSFSSDEKVITLGITLLAIVAIFQLFDGAQVTLTGILRGMQESRAPSAMVFSGYWLIGLPIGAYLTFKLNYGVEGLWIGLAISLCLVSIGLFLILNKKFKLLLSATH